MASRNRSNRVTPSTASNGRVARLPSGTVFVADPYAVKAQATARAAATAAAAARRATAKTDMAAKKKTTTAASATAASNSAKIDSVLKALDTFGLNLGDLGRSVGLAGSQPRPDVASAAAGSAAASAAASNTSQLFLIAGAGLVLLLLTTKGKLF